MKLVADRHRKMAEEEENDTRLIELLSQLKTTHIWSLRMMPNQINNLNLQEICLSPLALSFSTSDGRRNYSVVAFKKLISF